MSLEINIGTVLCRGRYKAIVHSGHEYDEAGKIIRFGEVKQETPFGRNLITKLGFDYRLGRTGLGSNTLMVCGPSSTPVTEDDLVMGDSFGYASQFASSTFTDSNANPANGPLFRKCEHRRTFPPGALGAAPVVVSKAGLVLASSTTPSLANLRTAPLLSGGLLIDHLGNPTGVSVLPTDYLDIIWQYTEFLTAEVTGEMPFTIDGVSEPRNYTARPLALWLSSGTRNWAPISSSQYFNFNPSFMVMNQLTMSSNGSTLLSGAGLEAITAVGETATTNFMPSAVTFEPLVNGSKKLRLTVSWAPTRGNVTPNVRRAIVSFGSSANLGHFQVLYDPPIPKNSERQIELTFELSMANAP